MFSKRDDLDSRPPMSMSKVKQRSLKVQAFSLFLRLVTFSFSQNATLRCYFGESPTQCCC